MLCVCVCVCVCVAIDNIYGVAGYDGLMECLA